MSIDFDAVLLRYFESVRDAGELPFANVAPLIRQNTLTLSETRITPSVATALGQFLEDTHEMPECWVHTLIIDDC